MDAGFYQGARTVPVTGNSSPITIRAAKAGKRILCTDLFLQAEGDVEIIVQSGNNLLTGAVNFKTGDARERLWQSQHNRPLFVCNGNEDFKLTINAGVQINGWAVIIEVEAQ